MSTELTKKDISLIAFKAAISASSIHSLISEKDNPIFIDDACELTGYSKATIYSLIHKKEIPFHKTAGRRRLYFLKSELLLWMAKGKEVVNTEKEAANGQSF